MKKLLSVVLLSLMLVCAACQKADPPAPQAQLLSQPSFAPVSAVTAVTAVTADLSDAPDTSAEDEAPAEAEPEIPVEEKKVTQEMVDRALELLMPGAALYEPRYPTGKTALLEQREIAHMQWEMNVSEGFWTQEQADAAMAQLEETIENAPDDTVRVPAQAVFHEGSLPPLEDREMIEDGSGQLVPAPLPIDILRSFPGFFDVWAVAPDGTEASFTANRGDSGITSYIRYSAMLLPQYCHTARQYERNVTDLPDLQVSYADARTQAESLVKDMGLGYLSACNPLSARIYHGRDESYRSSCYVFLFTKAPMSDEALAGLNDINQMPLTPENVAWSEDYVLVKVHNGGILAFDWELNIYE